MITFLIIWLIIWLFIAFIQDNRAPIALGTHAQQVSMRTIRIEPQPLSKTAKGGKMIDKSTLQSDIYILFKRFITLGIGM